VWPSPSELTGPVEILFVGINPMWTLQIGDSVEDANPTKNSGKTFSAYQEHIVRKAKPLVPPNAVVASTDLVPCGTPSGGDVADVAGHCRQLFFNKVVQALKPKVIVAIGRYASEQLFRCNTQAGRSGTRWPGLRKMHAECEHAAFGDHECSIVFVLQPSSHVSTEKRDRAMKAVAAAYRYPSAQTRS
jgi:uracil-DNA glycosylase